MTISGKPQLIVNSRCNLGEGPIWVANQNSLYWVDIEAMMIHSYQEKVHHHKFWKLPERIGFIVPDNQNGFIAGLESGLYQIHLASSKEVIIENMLPSFKQPSGYRFNDGACDPEGRLWAGNMDMACQGDRATFYCMDKTMKMREALTGFTVTNGPAFDPINRRIYFTETIGNDRFKRGVYVADLNSFGELDNVKPFVNCDSTDLYPDGMAVDTKGHIYVALWGGGKVQKYDTDGTLVEEIKLAVSNVTKVAFGGDQLKTLYITTAREGLSEDEQLNQPEAGGLFAVSVTTPGHPAQSFKNMKT